MPRSFEPVAGRRARVLILGSMPGLKSIEKSQYYGHPQNQFWRLLGGVLGIELQALSYPARLAAVKKRGVALWDTIAECQREGSLDSDIGEEVANAVPALVRELGIRAVFLNGGKAWAMYQRHMAEAIPAGVFVARLPSSSPAAALLPFAEKLRRWRVIADYL